MKPDQDKITFDSDDARAFCFRNGIFDGDGLFSLGKPVYRQHRGRCVNAATLEAENEQPVRVFIKKQEGRLRLFPRLTDLKTGQAFLSLPQREWDGIERLASIGMHVPERLALFHEGLFFFRAAIVLREVPPRQSADAMLRNGTWSRLALPEQDSLLDAIVSTMETIHQAGLIWRGASSKHFYPELQDDAVWKLWLIDCEGVYFRRSSRVRKQSYLRLFRSMKESGADFRTLDRFQRRIAKARIGTGHFESGSKQNSSPKRRAA
ncbi:MAG: hypothetical protein IID46_00325 [Planctomycetes bacterium]|nr:hypothetical protein [Planctomycetota bacterium]